MYSLFDKKNSPRKSGSRPVIKVTNKSAVQEIKHSGKEADVHSEEEKQEHSPSSTPETHPKLKREISNTTSSGDQIGAPQLSFKLDLDAIMEEQTDTSFYGKVLAYRNLTDSDQITPPDLSKRFSFDEYIMHITYNLNVIQCIKLKAIESLVALLSPTYPDTLRTIKSHNRFCNELLEVVKKCMCVSEFTSQNYTYLGNSSNKPSAESIKRYWDGLFWNVKLSDEDQATYKKLMTELIENCDKSFLMSEKMLNLVAKCNKTKQLSCFSWAYFNSICDFHNIHDVQQCVESYKKLYAGVGEVYVWLPAFLHLLKNDPDLEQLPESKDKIKQITNMFSDSEAFAEFFPHKGHSRPRLSFTK